MQVYARRMCGSGHCNCTFNGKRSGHGVGHLGAKFCALLVECQRMRCTHTLVSRLKLLGRVTDQNCSLMAPSRIAQVDHLSYMKLVAGAASTGIASYQQLACGWYCYNDGMSFLKARQPELCSLLTHIFLFVCWFSPRAHTFPFARLTQSEKILQSIAFSSLSDQGEI